MYEQVVYLMAYCLVVTGLGAFLMLACYRKFLSTSQRLWWYLVPTTTILTLLILCSLAFVLAKQLISLALAQSPTLIPIALALVGLLLFVAFAYLTVVIISGILRIRK